MKYHIITYGCQMNKSDSERITAILEKTGYNPAQNMSEADLVVVNMCSVRQSAVDRVYGKIKDFAKLKVQNSKLKTILTGCILKKDKNNFRKGFDLILDIKNLPNWPQSLNVHCASDRLFNEHAENYLKVVPKYQSSFSAFVPISNGCNNFCTYCVVPYVREREVCRPVKEILCEVENLVKRGYKEIWLLGQNVNSYGVRHETDTKQNTKLTQKINFAKLLQMVNQISGDFWIRFTSPHPKDFSDELIETMAECQKVTEYLNLPVQSGDNQILRKMNRPYTVESYTNLVKKIRKKIPGITLSTDIIVGFPGETEENFENTVKLFREVKFDMAYIAQYSPRPGTAAAKMRDNIPKKEKERREKILTGILKKTALEKNKKYIGKEVEVLINELRIMNNESRVFLGKTRSYKTVKIHNSQFMIHNSNLVGNFVEVEITDAFPWGLKGEIKKAKERF